MVCHYFSKCTADAAILLSHTLENVYCPLPSVFVWVLSCLFACLCVCVSLLLLVSLSQCSSFVSIAALLTASSDFSPYLNGIIPYCPPCGWFIAIDFDAAVYAN